MFAILPLIRVCILSILLVTLHGEAARIAVVGAGVGGAFASDHLRMLQGPSFQLDVFEENSFVGGRAMSFELHGQVNWLGIHHLWVVMPSLPAPFERLLMLSSITERAMGHPQIVPAYESLLWLPVTGSGAWRLHHLGQELLHGGCGQEDGPGLKDTVRGWRRWLCYLRRAPLCVQSGQPAGCWVL